MIVHGLVVSVNYADLLAASIERWLKGLTTLTVVTDSSDAATYQLALSKERTQVYVTDAFYQRGAAFNKGLAQQEAWRFVPMTDWILLFDADIIPPEDWFMRLCQSTVFVPGYLYGAHRFDEHGRKIADDTHGYGWFQLFHGTDPLTMVDPFFDTYWTHAGNGDSTILLRWRDRGRLAPPLPLHLVHPGGPSHNWYGRGNKADFERMLHERNRRGGGWASLEGERIP